MAHTTYGLAMADGLWHAACGCGWSSVPSADLGEQTEELDQHLRVIVVSEQRPTRASRVATSATLHAVDHTLLLAALVVGLLLSGPLASRAGRAA